MIKDAATLNPETKTKKRRNFRLGRDNMDEELEKIRRARKKGLYPRVMEWQQGVTRHTLDLVTGKHDTEKRSSTENEDRTFRVRSFDRIPPRSYELDMGLVHALLGRNGASFFLDPEYEVGKNNRKITRRGSKSSVLRQRKPESLEGTGILRLSTAPSFQSTSVVLPKETIPNQNRLDKAIG